jgi:hypothetical protein
MAQNKIAETVGIVVGEENIEPEISQPAQNVILDASTPSVRSIVRVVLVTLLILFVAGFVTTILSSLTYCFFYRFCQSFSLILIEPLVPMIRVRSRRQRGPSICPDTGDCDGLI